MIQQMTADHDGDRSRVKRHTTGPHTPPRPKPTLNIDQILLVILMRGLGGRRLGET